MTDFPPGWDFPERGEDDSSSLILGMTLSAMTMQQPAIAENGIKFERVEFVHDPEGTIRAIRVHMGSGAYVVTCEKESSALQARQPR